MPENEREIVRARKKDWKKMCRQFGVKWFQRDNLIILVLLGILLVVITLPVKTDWTTSGENKKMQTDGMVSSMAPDVGEDASMDYEALQEQKLTELLSSMEQVGEVRVMLTFVSSGEQVVEKEQPVSRSGTVEQDSEGGTRSVTKYERGDSTVYQNKEGQPFVTKVLYPKVEGVLVVAEGAGDGKVDRNITEAVRALFGVEAHRVKVLPMRNKHISQTGLIQ